MNADGLNEFLAVARAGSFTAAAKTLGVSVAHVSRQVARLEHRVGAKLFLRSTRSVRLSAAGETFVVQVRQAEDLLEAAYLGLKETAEQVQGKLRIAAPTGTIADRVVVPALVELAAEHPELEIHADFSSRHVDLVREGFDLAIRSGKLTDSALVARPLAERTFVAAASPEYLETNGMPEHPRDLQAHDCILTRRDSWDFVENGRPLSVPVRGRLWMNHGKAVLEACGKGLGIAYIASSGYESALEDGSVVPILKEYWRSEPAIFAVRVERDLVPARIEVVMDAVQRHARAFSRAEIKCLESLRVARG